MNGYRKLPNYDPDYCLSVAKLAALICSGILIVEVLILVFLEPSSCPIFTKYMPGKSGASLLTIVVMCTVAPTIWICYVVYAWQLFSKKIYESIIYKSNYKIFGLFGLDNGHRKLRTDEILSLDMNMFFCNLCIGWFLFCSIPLCVMITGYTDILRYVDR